MARLDRLYSVKEVAQIGAAIGREFSYSSAGCRIHLARGPAPGCADEARRCRAHLSYAACRRPRSMSSSMRWCRTPPTRLSSEAIGSNCTPGSPTSWKTEFPETAQTQPEILAHHYTQAGMVETAVEWWRRAGRPRHQAFGQPGGRQPSRPRHQPSCGQLPQRPDCEADELDGENQAERSADCDGRLRQPGIVGQLCTRLGALHKAR